MNQPNLFDTIREVQPDGKIRHRARSTDPPTSHQAANEIGSMLNALQARMLAAFAKPMTDNEAAAWCVTNYGEMMHETYRKRGGEIRGRLVECGKRKCAVTGRNAMTWRASE